MGIGHYFSPAYHSREVNIDMGEFNGYSYDNPEYAEDEASYHSNFTYDLVWFIQDKLKKLAPTGQCVNEFVEDYTRKIYETSLVEVTLTDNQVLWTLSVQSKDYDHNGEELNSKYLAEPHVDRIAKNLFDLVQEDYGELSVATGGYTSAIWDGNIKSC